MSIARRLLGGSVLLVAACAAHPPGGPANPGPLAEPVEPAQPGDPVVTVLEAGAEPRERLRYRIGSGPQPAMVADMDMAIAFAVGGRSTPPIKMPRMRTTMSISVPRVEPNGATWNVCKVTGVEVLATAQDRPQTVERLRQAVAGMVGLSMEMSITARGFVRGLKVDLPPGTPSEVAQLVEGMRGALQQASAAFPAEPVGVGARWRVESQLDTGTVNLRQVAVMKLLRREPNRAVLAVTVEQQAPPQPIRSAGLPPGASASLDQFHGGGEGQSDIRLDQRTPQATAAMKSALAYTMVMNETRTAMTMEMTMALKIAPGATP